MPVFSTDNETFTDKVRQALHKINHFNENIPSEAFFVFSIIGMRNYQDNIRKGCSLF